MRVLITGAAGSIGQSLLNDISNDPSIEAVLFDRDRKFLKMVNKKYNYEVYPGDIRSPQDILRATKDIDIAIHLLSLIPPAADIDKKTTYDINVIGTINLIKGLKENSANPFLLYTSSISVYGDRLENYYISVDDPVKPSYMDYYGRTKVMAEELVKKSGLDFSIFRLTGIMGKESGRRGIKGSLLFHMPLKTRIEIATTRDTGFALYQALFHKDKIKGKIFNLGGGTSCRTSYRELLTILFSSYGIKLSDLPDKAFATCNFHCGYYIDSNKLESIFHFQRDSIETFSKWAIKRASWVVRLFVRIFYRPVIKYISSKSEPLKAYLSNNYRDLKRFFGISRRVARRI